MKLFKFNCFLALIIVICSSCKSVRERLDLKNNKISKITIIKKCYEHTPFKPGEVNKVIISPGDTTIPNLVCEWIKDSCYILTYDTCIIKTKLLIDSLISLAQSFEPVGGGKCLITHFFDITFEDGNIAEGSLCQNSLHLYYSKSNSKKRKIYCWSGDTNELFKYIDKLNLRNQ